jgi:glycosyltransferase involved in cell wall biosynthesis
LHDIVPDVDVTVVPNGVDVERYSAFAAPEGLLPPNSLVFTGTMDYRPNVDAVLWFAQRVLPLVRQRVPSARFYVVGRRPHPRLEPLRPRDGHPDTGIEITGSVPDTRPYIAGASLYVVPLRSGGGTRLKVLEAMAMRCPIVSTSMGVDGFPVVSGRDVQLADAPEAFAESVVQLLGDGQRRAELGQAGYEFAASRYDWSAIVPLLERAYRG